MISKIKVNISLYRSGYFRLACILICCFVAESLTASLTVQPDTVPVIENVPEDTLSMTVDSLGRVTFADIKTDTAQIETKKTRFKRLKDWEPIPDSLVFNPDPMKAVWYSALCPGLGQIYNRRYWKLPIVIGGYMGLIYATSWNGRYYTDYSNAYRDIMDSDPTTNSFINFLPYNRRNDSQYIEEHMDWLKGVMKRKKDFYRRNRDLCIISMVGLYIVSMIDAYVDAQLYHFDITPDITMHLLPAVLEPTPFSRTSLGMQCAITF